MSSTTQCGLCLEDVEDLDHVLHWCSNAQEVWHALDNIEISSTGHDQGLPEWLQHNLNGTHDDPDWSPKFAMTLWYIWKWRCAKCFGSTRLPVDIGEFLVRKLQEALHALQMETRVPRSTRTNPITELIRWEPPNGGWRVLNTDGAARGTLGLAGAGGVLRDGMGAWIIGSVSYTHLSCRRRG